MLTLSTLTRLFATAIAGIGVLQLIFRQVLIGRPPAFITNETVAVVIGILTALMLILCAIQLWRESPNRILLLTTSVFVFAYAGLSNFFLVLSNTDYGGVLTSFGKSISLGSGLLLFLNLTATGSPTWTYNLCRTCLGVFLTISGIQHFLFVDFVKFLVPRWIPFDLFWAYAAGVALIISGLSLITKIKIKLVALLAGWMVFVWVIVLHIPRGIAEPNASELTAVCEALAFSTLLLTVSRLSDDR